MNEPSIIVVDGLAYSGKSTLIANLGRAFGIQTFSIGTVYRHLARQSHGADDVIMAFRTNAFKLTLTPALIDSLRTDPGLRQPEFADLAAQTLSTHRFVRKIVDTRITSFVRDLPGLIVDGKDAARQNFPDAPVHLFLTANAQTRAARFRLEQMQKNPDTALSPAQALEKMQQRDLDELKIPGVTMHPTEKACVVDTSSLTPDEVQRICAGHITRLIPGLKPKAFA